THNETKKWVRRVFNCDSCHSLLGVPSMSIECSKCAKPAVYLRRYTAERLCKACLASTTLQRVRRTINREKMLREDDRIAVAVSGGKDSAVLLDVLFRVEQDFPSVELVPITIDEGIRGYRDKALESAKELASNLSLRLEVRDFSSIFGQSLDEIVTGRDDNSVGACSYCGVLRRRAINTVAKELAADIVVTGHNLDDEAQTVIMNMMRGDSRRIARINRSRTNPIGGLVPRVKPIKEISERDIVAYTHHLSLPYHDVPCPYAVEAYRNDIREFLNRMEHKRPGTLLAILRSSESITEAFERNTDTSSLQTCDTCGDPSSSRICKVCSMLADLRAE
ncbi:MAG: TIGR00269 family protein, partial [Candidatus Thorarchaeota archaeon]